MKNNNLNSKARKSFVITGAALACVAIAAVALHMGGGVTAAAEPTSSATSCSPSTAVSIYVPPIEPTSTPEIRKSGTSSAFVPSSGASKAAELTKIEKPVSAPPAPSVASGTDLTDKNKKPSYPSSSAPAKGSGGKSTSSTTKKTATGTTPKNGTVKDGKTYVEGFGWVDGTGAGGQGTTVDGDGDINKQVATMD